MTKRNDSGEPEGSSGKPNGSGILAGGVEFSPSPSVTSDESPATPVVIADPKPELAEPASDDGAAAPVVVIEDGDELEVEGRGGSVLKRGAVEANVDGDTKNRDAKGIKTRRAPKAPKPAKVKKAAVEEELALPINVNVDFYRGLTKEREAEQVARAWVERNYDAPNASYIYIMPWRDGMAVEMQEGGGKAYLPEVLAKLDEDPTAICVLPMSNRVMQVYVDSDRGTLEGQVLTAGRAPDPDAFIALPTKNMTPFDKRGSKVFVVGVALLAASLIALTFSVGAFFIDTKAWSLPYIQQTRVNDLPSVQSQKLKAALEQGDCVAKMEYLNGSWNIVTGWNDGSGVCTSQRPIEPVAPSAEEPVMGADGSLPMPMPAPAVAGPAIGPAGGMPMPKP